MYGPVGAGESGWRAGELPCALGQASRVSETAIGYFRLLRGEERIVCALSRNTTHIANRLTQFKALPKRNKRLVRDSWTGFRPMACAETLHPKSLHACQTWRARGYSRTARCARRQLNPSISAGACYDTAQLHIRPQTSARLSCSLTHEIATALALPAEPTADARARWERNIGMPLPIAQLSPESLK